MRYLQFDDARGFCARCAPFLEANEAENNLIIGLANRLAEQAAVDWNDTCGPPVLCAVEKADQIVAAAVMTPPHRLVITDARPDAVELMVQGLRQAGIAPPGVLGPAESSRLFAETWARHSGQPVVAARALRIYQLDEVLPPPPTRGMFVPATLRDCDLVVRWSSAFWAEVGERAGALPETMRRRVEARQLYLWTNPQPVAMAGFTGPTPNGMRIGLVYTPPEHRRRGYATALTAALSQHLLDSGYQRCFLFTDLANRTSNHIYQKVGYEPVCDWQEYEFNNGIWPQTT